MKVVLDVVPSIILSSMGIVFNDELILDDFYDPDNTAEEQVKFH